MLDSALKVQKGILDTARVSKIILTDVIKLNNNIIIIIIK